MRSNNNYKPQLINQDNSYKPSTIIIIVTIIVIILLGFYFITKIVLENKKETNEVTESIIKSEKIIFGQLLDRKEEEYYVIAYDSKKNFKQLYDKYLNNYKSKDNSIKVYEIDLNDGFNKKFVTKDSNISNNINDLTVNDEVLFKIKSGKIDSYYIGSNDINNILKEISE